MEKAFLAMCQDLFKKRDQNDLRMMKFHNEELFKKFMLHLGTAFKGIIESEFEIIKERVRKEENKKEV